MTTKQAEKKRKESLKFDAEMSLPSLLYILNALEKYLELNLGWGLRDKSSYKQKNISETTGHDPLKGSWESCKGIPGTLALPSQSSPQLRHFREEKQERGETLGVHMFWGDKAAGLLSRQLLMESLRTSSTFPLSFSIKHLPFTIVLLLTRNSTLSPAPEWTSALSSKCNLQWDLFLSHRQTWSLALLPQNTLTLLSSNGTIVICLDVCHLLLCPLHCAILRAFFKGRNWVTLISASLGLAKGWSSSKQSTSALKEWMKGRFNLSYFNKCDSSKGYRVILSYFEAKEQCGAGRCI